MQGLQRMQGYPMLNNKAGRFTCAGRRQERDVLHEYVTLWTGALARSLRELDISMKGALCNSSRMILTLRERKEL